MSEETGPAHAKFAPSAAHRWIPCPGSVVLEAQFPDETNEHAEYGTAAHELAAVALEQGADAAAYQGRMFNTEYQGGFEADADMVAHVQAYLDALRDYAEGHDLWVEQRLDMSRHVPGCWGTGDGAVIADDEGEIQLHDLKFGKGVQVYAEENPQLMLYGIGLLEVAEMLGDYDQVRLVIHQPRLNHLDEWACSVEHLRSFAQEAAQSARQAKLVQQGKAELTEFLQPGDTQCRFCKAKATCPAVANAVAEELFGNGEALEGEPKEGTRTAEEATAAIEEAAETAEADPDAAVSLLTNTQIARIMPHLDMIEQWTKAVRAHAEAELLAGREVPGYKVVEGRRGNRKWTNKEEVEDVLRNQFRLPQSNVYKQTLIGPADIDRLHKDGKLGQRRYQKIQAYIDQPEGKPAVVPETDKRPPLAKSADASEFEFTTETQE
jgi:hypothetical protein